MEELKAAVLGKWLNIDLDFIANKMGFAESEVTVSEELVYETIRCLDYETCVSKKPSINYVITVIALMWEYIDHNKYDVSKLIVKFLSRIGYPTSAIIADEGYDRENCIFSSLGSTIDNLLTTLNQETNEVTVNGHKFLLTNFQMNIWRSMDSEKIIGISAPTSAGKSFVILLKLLEKLSKENFDIVYIVPTLSLLNQVSEDFNTYLNRLNVVNCSISNSVIGKESSSHNNIYILTQEKAIAAFCSDKNVFSNNLILVADEIQNIERIKEDNDERAKILFDTLNEFRYKENVKQVIISGPRINDIDITGKSIFGIETESITSLDSPVLNLTYSICKSSIGYNLKQYCAITKQPLQKAITNQSSIIGYGYKLYDSKFLSFLNELVNRFPGQQNIIFSPTAATARKIACSLDGERNTNELISELIDYYKKSIHPSYSMCNTLEKGAAYHHGKLPEHVRRTLEDAIHKKYITNIACTTTLLQGVNLPTQNIIIRNPHLYLIRKSTSAELSSYEMANLRGRAGRLLKDFVGRTFVLDETSFDIFDNCQQVSLFEDTTKELPSGYEDRFEKYYENIEQVIETNQPVSRSMEKYGDLLIYIRQSILRHGTNARKKMNNVGIKLTKEQVAAIVHKLDELTVPKEICLKNRYWDPFVLETIYQNFSGTVPAHPMERGAATKLDNIMKFLRDTPDTSGIYDKYIPSNLQKGKNRTYLRSLCMKWAKETPLSDIILSSIHSRGDDISAEIEDIIEILQNTVSYKVPLLLKPIFDIKNPDSSFLSCMQDGAYNKVSRILIEMGVPRECALQLSFSLFSNYNTSDKDDLKIESEIRETLIASKKNLPYWICAQLNFFGE